MAWEDLLKRQTDLLTRLANSAGDWRTAKDKVAAGNFTADEAATNMVKFWDRLLNVWWGPFDLGSPNIPTLLITPAVNPGSCRLLNDTITANVSITDLSLIGGNVTITGIPAGPPPPLPAPPAAPQAYVTKTVTQGTKLQVQVFNVPAANGLYQGLALEGNEPIALVILKV